MQPLINLPWYFQIIITGFLLTAFVTVILLNRRCHKVQLAFKNACEGRYAIVLHHWFQGHIKWELFYVNCTREEAEQKGASLAHARNAVFNRCAYMVVSIPETKIGWEVLPEDLRTHLGDFQSACEISLKVAQLGLFDDTDSGFDQEPYSDDADELYWQHQLNTIANIKKQLRGELS